MARIGFSSIVFVLCGLVGCGNDVFPLSNETGDFFGHFSAGPNLLHARFEHASVVLPDGRVMVTGGADPKSASWEAFAAAEIFNPETNQWSSTPEMTLARFAHQAVVLDDGQVAVMGGQNNASPPGPFSCVGNVDYPLTPYLCNAELFEPIQGWSTNVGMDMRHPRVHFTATAVKEASKVVVCGGTAQEIPNSYEMFDAYTGTWDDIPVPTNGVRALHASAALPDEDILLIGGAEGDGTAIANVDRFDVATNSWSTAGALNVPRHTHTATSLRDGRILVTGGVAYDSGAILASTEIFDNNTNTWSFGPAMLEKRSGHAAALLIGNRRVLVIGGVNDANGTSTLLENAEILDLDTITWTKIETPLARHWLPTMHVLPTDGRVLILGGATISIENVNGTEKTVITPLATTAFFTPPCASHFECAPGFRCGVSHECVKDDI